MDGLRFVRVEVEDFGEVFRFTEEALDACVDLEDGGGDEDLGVAHESVDDVAEGVCCFVAKGE